MSRSFKNLKINPLRLAAWTRGRGRLVARVCSLLLALTFVLPHLSWALDALNYSPAAVALGAPWAIPAELGVVTDFYPGNARLVVCIQDLHCNYEVQTNIRRLLEVLAKKHALGLVAVEGAGGAVNAAGLATFPVARVKTAAAEYLLRQGKITGAEYYAALDPAPVPLSGAETPGLYDEAWKLLQGFLNNESLGLAADLRDGLDAAQETVYGPELKALDRRRRAFREGRSTLLAYAAGLVNSLGSEQGEFPELMAFVSKRRNLWAHAAAGDELYADLERAEARVRARWLRNPEERRLDELEQRLDLDERVLNISATPEDLEKARLRPADFTSGPFLEFFQRHPGSGEALALGEGERFDQMFAQALAFYRVADLRSRALADNTLARMQSQKTGLAALVAGGYHAPGIVARLRQQGASVLCVRPVLSRTDWVNPYFSILRSEHTPLEKFLSQHQNILAPRLNFATPSPLFARVLHALLAQLTVLSARVEGARTLAQLQAYFQAQMARYPLAGPGGELNWAQGLAQAEEGKYLIPAFAGAALLLHPGDSPGPDKALDSLSLGTEQADLIGDPATLSSLRAEMQNSQASSAQGFKKMRQAGWFGVLAGLVLGALSGPGVRAFASGQALGAWLLGLSAFVLVYAGVKGFFIARAFSDKPKIENWILGLHAYPLFDPEKVRPAANRENPRQLDAVTPAGEIRIARQVKYLPAFLQYTVWAHARLHQRFPRLPEPAVYFLEIFAGAALWLLYPARPRAPGGEAQPLLLAAPGAGQDKQAVAAGARQAVAAAARRAQANGLLALHFLEYQQALLQHVNPEGRPLTAAYGAAGPDVSSLLLSTNFSTAHFIDVAPISLAELQKHMHDPLEKGSAYFSAKYRFGFSDLNDFKNQTEKWLIQELLALGAEPAGMRADQDSAGRVFLEFSLPGDLKPRTIYFVAHDLLEPDTRLNRALGGRVDVYYQKAAMDAQRGSNAFRHWKDVRAWLKPGALILLNEHDEYGNKLEVQSEFHTSFLEVTGEALKRLADRVAEHVAYEHRYGWEMFLWRSRYYQPAAERGPAFADLERSLANLRRARGAEEIHQQLVNGVMDLLHVSAVSAYSVTTEREKIAYQSLARAGMRHPTGAEQVRSMSVGNEKYFLFGPGLEAGVPGVFAKTRDFLSIQQRHLAPFVDKKELLRDVVAYAGLPQAVSDGLQALVLSPWFPRWLAAAFVRVLAVAAKPAVARVDQAWWILLRDPDGVPQGLLLVNNWDTGRPLPAGGDLANRLTLLPVLTGQAWAGLRVLRETKRLSADLAEIKTAVNQLNGSFGNRLVSQDMRDTIHSLRGALVSFAFLPRLMKKLKSLDRAVEQLQAIFTSLGANQAQINELLDGVRVAEDVIGGTPAQQVQQLAAFQAALEARGQGAAVAIAGDGELARVSQELIAAPTPETAVQAAGAALDRLGADAAFRPMVLALATERCRQLLEAESLRVERAAMGSSLEKLKKFSKIFEFTRDLKRNIVAIRKVLDNLAPEDLENAGGEPVNVAGAVRDLRMLEEIIHRVNVFEHTLDQVLRQQGGEQGLVEAVPVLTRVVATGRSVFPDVAFEFAPPAPAEQKNLTIRIDPAKLEFLLLNEMVTNAVKYGAKHVVVSAAAEGAELVIAMQDDGAGLSPARLAEVRAGLAGGTTVSPDQRVAAGISAGIGLSQMQRVAQEAGGRLEVESAGQGLGARVSVRLTLAQLKDEEQLAQSAFQAISAALSSADPAPALCALMENGKIYQAIPEMRALADLQGGVAWGNRNMLDFTQGVLATLGQLKALAALGDARARELSTPWAELQKTRFPNESLHPIQVEAWVDRYRRVAAQPQGEALLWLLAMTIMTGKTDTVLPQDRFRLAAITARNIVKHYQQETGEPVPAEQAEKIAQHYSLIGDYVMAEITPREVARVLRPGAFSEDELALLTLLAVAVIKNVGETGKLTPGNLADIFSHFDSLPQVQKALALGANVVLAARLQAWSAGEELTAPREPGAAHERAEAIERALAQAAAHDPAALRGMDTFLNDMLFYHSYFLFNALTPESLAKMIYAGWKLQTALKNRWMIFDTDALPSGLETALAAVSWAELDRQVAAAARALAAGEQGVLLGMNLSQHEDQLLVRVTPGRPTTPGMGEGVTLYSSVLPTLLVLSAFSGNLWMTFALVAGVTLYHGARRFFRLLRWAELKGIQLKPVGRESGAFAAAAAEASAGEYTLPEERYFRDLGEAFARMANEKFGELSAVQSPAEQLDRVRREAEVQADFVRNHYARYAQRHPELAGLLARTRDDVLRFLASVQPGTLGFTYVAPAAAKGDFIPTAIKWLTKFFGTEAPMHSLVGIEPGVFLHATGRPGLRRVMPASALYIFVHSFGAVTVTTLPGAFDRAANDRALDFALASINTRFNFKRLTLGKLGRFFPGTICTDFVFGLSEALGAKILVKSNPFNGFSVLAAALAVTLASPLLLLLAWGGLSGLSLSLAGLAVFLAAFWNYHDVPTPYQIFQGTVAGEKLETLYAPRKSSHSSLSLLAAYFKYARYRKDLRDYFLPSNRRDVWVVVGAFLAVFLFYLMGAAHLDAPAIWHWGAWLQQFLPSTLQVPNANLAVLGLAADPSLAGGAHATLGAAIVGALARPSQPTEATPAAAQTPGEAGPPAGLRPGWGVRSPGTFLQRWAVGGLKGVLFSNEGRLAGQVQGRAPLEGMVAFFQGAFYLAQGLLLSWLAWDHLRAPATPANEAWKTWALLQSTEETAFRVFAQYGQGGLGELAPLSTWRGSARFWRLGASETFSDGRTVYYVPDALLRAPGSRWRAFWLRVLLEYQVQRVYAQNRPDVEMAAAQSWGAGWWANWSRAWWLRFGAEAAVKRMLAADHSALAENFKDDQTPLGQGLQAWLSSPEEAPDFLPALGAALETGTPAEQLAAWATVSTLCEQVPGLASRRLGTVVEAGGPWSGRVLRLPALLDLAPYRGLKRGLLEKLEQLPGVLPERRPGLSEPNRHQDLDQAA